MCNNTFFDYYRIAIKAKYDIDKDGEYSNNLNPPSLANLRNLCIKRFKLITNKDDLETFRSFFGFEFDGGKRNLITRGTDLNKFRAIGDFFKGETLQPTEDTIHFAAILLDFQPRPFNKFKKVMDGKNENEIFQELAKDYQSEKYNDKYDNYHDSGYDTKNGIIAIVPEVKNENPITQTDDKDNGVNTDETSNETFFEKLKENKVSVIAIISLLLIACYFIFFNKGCMQWSDNHYEVVNCKDGIEGNPNEIIQYNSHLLDFKMIPVCDTTTWFANGKSIIWYAKTNNEVDFFTTCGNGRHPESGSTIRPLTNYMFNRYKKKDCSSK